MSRGTRLTGCVLVALVAYGVLIAWVVVMHLPVDGPTVALLAVIALWVSLPVQIVLHECGHALAAVSVGLPIAGVRLFGRQAFGAPGSVPRGPHHVALNPDAHGRWLPGRLVWFAVAGPAANLAVGAAAWLLARDADATWYVRVIAAGTAMSGVLLGVGNLVPSRRGQLDSDGRRIAQWVLRRQQISRVPDAGRIRLAAVANSGDPRPPQLELAAADSRAAVAGPAVQRLLSESIGDSGAEAAVRRHYDDVVRVLRLPDVTPPVVRGLAGGPGLMLVATMTQRVVTERRKPDPAWVERIVALLELGLERTPGELVTRSALSMARLLQDRDEEARRLLLDIDVDRATNDDVALAYGVRAIAEAACGDVPQARRLLRAAQQHAPDDAIVRLGSAVVDLVERRRTLGDGSG